jgi:hypothetical protein
VQIYGANTLIFRFNLTLKGKKKQNLPKKTEFSMWFLEKLPEKNWECWRCKYVYLSMVQPVPVKY